MNKPENNKIAQLFENLKQTEEKYNQLSKAEKAIKDIDFVRVQSVGEIESEQNYYRNEIEQTESEIKQLQSACPHNDENVKRAKDSQFYSWFGNEHNCDYYKCKECGHEIKI